MIDHPPLTRLEERVRDAGEPTYLFGGFADPDEETIVGDPPGYWDRICESLWRDQEVQESKFAPAIVEQVELAGFPTEATFPERLFEIANLLLDIRDPVTKFAAEQLAKVAHRAEYLSATTPEEYDAREAAQEEWAAEGRAGR